MTLRWARGQEGRFDAPLSSSGLHLPLTRKGLLAPFRPQRRSRNAKMLALRSTHFLSFSDLESLRDGRRPTAANAPSRNDLSREKREPENPQIFWLSFFLKAFFRCFFQSEAEKNSNWLLANKLLVLFRHAGFIRDIAFGPHMQVILSPQVGDGLHHG